MTTKQTTTSEKWFIIDAKGKTIGKIAEKTATIVRGKHRVDFDPSKDNGDNVIIINAAEVRISRPRKLEYKKYYSHSRYPSGLKTKSLGRMLNEKPELVIQKAVSGMLPKNKLRAPILKKRLKIYAGNEHPHEAQKPEPIEL